MKCSLYVSHLILCSYTMNVHLICVIVIFTALGIHGNYPWLDPNFSNRPYVQNFIPANQASPSQNCVCGQMPLTMLKEQPSGDLAVRVVGGTRLLRNENPTLATIYYKGDFICGGSIVSPYHILTAAHCVENSQEKDMQVYLGVYDREHLDTAEYFPVREIIRHSGYKEIESSFVVNDLALLKVDKINFKKSIQPLCLPFNSDFEGIRSASVAGWGVTTFNGQSSRFPQVATLNVMSPEECINSAWGPIMGRIPDSYKMVICAYKPAVDACQGDSGGPLYVRSSGGTLYQIGVISFGDECGNEEGIPGMYMKLSYFRNWLWEHLHAFVCSGPL